MAFSGEEHSILMGLHTQIDAKIVSLEAMCLDVKTAEAAHKEARIRRTELIAVRDYLMGKTVQL